MSVVVNDQVKLTSPEEVAAAHPALIGFNPLNSIVVVFLRMEKVVVCMPSDIPTSWAEVAGQIEQIACRVDADSVILSICCARGTCDLPFREEVGSGLATLSDTFVSVVGAMLVVRDQYWSYFEKSLAAPDGSTFAASDASRFLAQRIGEGLVTIAANRDEVVARYRPEEALSPSSEIITEVAKSMSREPKFMAAKAWQAVCELAADPELRTVCPEGDRLRAVLMLAVSDVRARDYVLGRIAAWTDSPMPLVDVVVETALRAPLHMRTRIAGMAAALMGAFEPSTIPASSLVELAEGDSLAELVKTSLGSAVPPSAMREVLTQSLPLVLTQLEGSNKWSELHGLA